MQTLRLTTSLRGFSEPSTSSLAEGTVPAGSYTVLEVRERFPDQGTDFARVAISGFPAGDTWLCTRWSTRRYGELVTADAVEVPPRQNFDADPRAITEATLLGRLKDFVGYRYDLDETWYPWDLPGIRIKVAGASASNAAANSPAPAADAQKRNNCCTFAEGLIVKSFSETPGFAWSKHAHGQFMIADVDADPFSPVTALLESGAAVAATARDAGPHPWALVQGWRDASHTKGHTFIVVDHHPKTDKVLILESNCAHGLNGVGFRGIGSLTDALLAPGGLTGWWTNPNVWTWQRLVSTYPERDQAWLRVKARSLSAMDAAAAPNA